MKKSEIDLTKPVFVVINGTRGTWASHNDRDKAKRDAQVRKTDRFTLYRVTDIEKEPLKEAQLDFRQNGGLSYSDYKPGDLLHPWCDNRGGLVYNGTCHRYMEHCDSWWPISELGRTVSPTELACVNALKAILLTPGLREFLDDNAPELVKGGVEAVQNSGFSANK